MAKAPAVIISLVIGLLVFFVGSYILRERVDFPPFSDLKVADATSIVQVKETSYYNRGMNYQLHIKLDDGTTVDYLSWFGKYPDVKEAFARTDSVKLWIGMWGEKVRIFQVASGNEVIASYEHICTRRLRNWTVGVGLIGVLVSIIVYYSPLLRRKKSAELGSV